MIDDSRWSAGGQSRKFVRTGHLGSVDIKDIKDIENIEKELSP